VSFTCARCRRPFQVTASACRLQAKSLSTVGGWAGRPQEWQCSAGVSNGAEHHPLGDGHIMLTTPALVRSLKLSSLERS
jgi:hypothetical protein